MILIRADANEKIGTGHVMRCLSIARAFAQKGEKVIFATADHKGDGFIREFETICLDTRWEDMESELEKLIDLLDQIKPSLLLVDSYCVTENYFRELRKKVRIAYMDDLNMVCPSINYIVNYNIYYTIFDYTLYEKAETKLLLGPQYAPLRNEFKNVPQHKIKDTITDVLVSSGGADPEGVTVRLMQEICPTWKYTRFHFIVGALNLRLDEIKKIAEDKSNIVLHINEQHMSDLMKRCDIAISAAGITLYELCATGIPTITYTLADNQIEAAEQFERQGIMLNIGDCRDNNKFINRIESCLRKLAKDKDLRLKLSRKMQTLVDGNGADRVAAKLLWI